MKKHLNMLGLVYRDKISGFEGVVESISFDLYGCIQVCVRPQNANGGKDGDSMPKAVWFDQVRMDRVVGVDRVMDVPKFLDNPVEHRDNVPGPADKSNAVSARS